MVFAFLLLWRFKKQIENLLTIIVKKNQKFAAAKKSIQQENKEDKKNALSVSKSGKIVKILKLGLYTSNLTKTNISYAKVDKKELQKTIKKLREVKLTFFKVPEIYVDYIQRSWANSFREFLKEIYESPRHFPKWKLQSSDSWKSVSVRLDILKNRYREYCTKEGYKPQEIEKQKYTIKEFKLKIKWKMDSTTDAYTNIRWKTPLEKINHAQTTSIRLAELELEKNSSKNNFVVMQFLESE